LLALDLLRAAAVALVLGRHLAFVRVPAGHSEAFRAVIDAWVRGGWVGVDLFFVLSGFLVSGLLFAEYRARGTLAVGRFYVRRGFKIYPPFWALLAATALLFLVPTGTVPWGPLAIEFFFLQCYVTGVWDHTWSLAVEEHFYLLLPLVLLLLARARRGSTDPFRPLLWLVPLVGVVCLNLRVLNAGERPHFTFVTHLFPTHLRIDSLFYGVLLGYGYHFHRAWFDGFFRRRRWPLAAAGVVAFVPAFLLPVETTPGLYTLGLTVLALGGAALVGVLVAADVPSWRVLRAVGYVGSHSYSIYLWHLPVLLVGVPYLVGYVTGPLHYPQLLVVYLGGSLLVGIGMANVIELPVLRLRSRLFPARGRSAV